MNCRLKLPYTNEQWTRDSFCFNRRVLTYQLSVIFPHTEMGENRKRILQEDINRQFSEFHSSLSGNSPKSFNEKTKFYAQSAEI